jgi:peptidoglycan/xylan/chitin deacetylase (PgdA/CDA1 family)
MRLDAPFRKAAKTAILPLGLRDRRRKDDVVVLVYHRVGAGEREIDLSAAQFERQLASLERDTVISLDDALSGKGGVVLSFDDGLVDFHQYVMPALARHSVPAVLYLATGLVSQNGDEPNSESLTWPHLRDAVSTGLVTIGSHTHDHVDLSGASERIAASEMRRSKALIEDKLGVPCRHFAYPFGRGSAAADRIARCEFASVADGTWRTNRGRIDPYRLGRTPVLRSDGIAFFRAKAAGLLAGEALLYRAARRGPWRRS